MPGSTRFAIGLVFDCLGCSMHALPRCYIINQSINGNNRTIFRLRVAFIRWLLTRNSFSKFLVCFQWNESRLILRAMNSGIKFFLLPYLWCGIYGLWAAKNIYGMGSSGAQTLCYGLWDDYGKTIMGQHWWASYQDAYHVKSPPFASRVNQLAGWHALTLAESCSPSLAMNIFWTVTIQLELPLSKIFLFSTLIVFASYSFPSQSLSYCPQFMSRKWRTQKNRAKGTISSWRWHSGVTLSNSRKKTKDFAIDFCVVFSFKSWVGMTTSAYWEEPSESERFSGSN